MWYSYIITFVVSLVVALASVWFAQYWSAKKDYARGLRNLKAELLTNAKVSNLIYEWADKTEKELAKGELVAASCPHFYNNAWLELKGALYPRVFELAVDLEDLYLQSGVVNDFIVTMEELKWGAGSAMTGTEIRRKIVLKAIREIVKGILIPKLEEENKVIDNLIKS
jgi:hypothetical protein